MKNFVFYILPLLLWMALIFKLSAVPASDLPPMPSDFWLFWAHKATHFVEYLVLGFLAQRLASRYAGMNNKILIVLIFLFALSDEWHQSFTPGRTPSIMDSSTDLLYGWIGMLLYAKFQNTFKKL